MFQRQIWNRRGKVSEGRVEVSTKETAVIIASDSLGVLESARDTVKVVMHLVY